MIKIIKNFFNWNIYKRIISGILFVTPFLFSIFKGGVFFVLFFIFLLVMVVYEFNISSKNKIGLPIRFIVVLFFIVSFFHFIFLRIAFDDFIITYLLYVIFSVWIFDSFSLIGGRLIGGRKLMPRISPNKTYSGLVTGFLSLLIFSILLIFFYKQNITVILFTLIIGLISFVGDAIESYCKRFLDIKDFSNFMPGHGGILDRMDAFILIFIIHFVISILFFNPAIFYG